MTHCLPNDWCVPESTMYGSIVVIIVVTIVYFILDRKLRMSEIKK